MRRRPKERFLAAGLWLKAKGRFLLRDLAPASEFSKIWFGTQITTTRHFRVIRDVRAEPAVSRTPSSHFAARAFLFHRGGPVSRVLRESRFGFPCGLPLRFPCGSRLRCSSKVPLPVPLPNFVPDSHPEVLPQSPCEFRFRFRWRSFPGVLANSASGSPMAPVYSLLLEDCSSVELKDISRSPRKQGV